MADPAFWTDLVQRDIIRDHTHPDLGPWIQQQLDQAGPDDPMTVYCGFDPTADSLHLGSLMPVLGLRRLRDAGLKPIVLVGGATGMIGDPSGKASERSLLDLEQVAANADALGQQLESLLEGKIGTDFLLVNNFTWIDQISVVDYLRDIGKCFSVNAMMAKESVKARLENREQGISYTEFSYMILQAIDFLHLFKTYNCRLQVGGSDQWGNITAGMDLIQRTHPEQSVEAHGFTLPLIMTSAGTKFGKSESGTVWLDAKRTHPYFFYKYLFHTDERDVIKFVNYFTFLSLEDRQELEKQNTERPQDRAAQKALAREVTSLVHGTEVALACENLEVAMHQDDVPAFETHADALGLLDPNSVDYESAEATKLPVKHVPMSKLAGEGLSAVALAQDAGLFKSKSEARREIDSGRGGFRIAGEPVNDVNFMLTPDLLAGKRVLQMRKGKRNKCMVIFYKD